MMHITLDFNQPTTQLDAFWRSTGFTPAHLLLDADMQQAMALTGAVPHSGIAFVRIHYLLELVDAHGLQTDAASYDWTRLDAALDVLVRHHLRPVFELMGNVAGYFHDYTDPGQAHAWKRLIRELACHLEQRYGADEVRQWLFETWNEPDIGFWKQSDEAFLIYYDACSEGLREADPALRFGGPGTCRGLSSTLKLLLAHCDDGANYFTGERGVRLDFISVHEKGVRAHREDLTPDSMGIVEREAQIIRYIHQRHPRFAALPFFNDECDPQVGWGDIHTWRARPYYAALVAKIINQHLLVLANGLNCTYGLLSNDNGFLGAWGNRTLFVRFSEYDHLDLGQADGQRDPPRRNEDPRRRQFALIKKPVFNIMTLLSLLGDERYTIAGLDDPAAEVGAIVTRRKDEQIAILLYNSRDTIMASGATTIKLRLENVPFTQAMMAHYRIGNGHGDPFVIWEAQGAPDLPTPQQFDALRAQQELMLLEEPRELQLANRALELVVELPLPSVSLVLLSSRPAAPPARIVGLHCERYEGLSGLEQVLLLWDGLPERTLRTYEVLCATDANGPFKRVNAEDQLSTAYLHARTAGPHYYRIRAIDYWGRSGELSDILEA